MSDDRSKSVRERRRECMTWLLTFAYGRDQESSFPDLRAWHDDPLNAEALESVGDILDLMADLNVDTLFGPNGQIARLEVNPSDRNSKPVRERRREAVLWHFALHDPDISEQTRCRFATWKQDPFNQQAMEYTEDLLEPVEALTGIGPQAYYRLIKDGEHQGHI